MTVYNIAMKNTFLVLPFACLLFSTACNRQAMPEGMPPLVPLTLTITQESAPLAGATVRLYPDDDAVNWASGGLTDENGSLVVYTRGRYPGIPAGTYRVVVDHVTAEVPRPKSGSDAEFAKHDRDYPPFRTVPAPYASAKETPLKIEVVKGTDKIVLDIPETVKDFLKVDL